LEKERRVIIEEIRGYVDSPSEWVHTLIQQALLGDQPLGRDIAGTVETVGAIDHTTMEAFWREHYQPARMVISVAGCIPAERVIAAVEERFKQCPVQPARPPEPARPIEPGPRLTLHYRDTEQGNFCIGLPGMADNDPDRRAFAVLDTVLGGDMASRLFQEIREERGLAYNVGSDRQLFSDTGIWVIYGSVQRTLLRDSIRAALTILGQLLHEGITLDELDYVKEQVKGGLLLSQDDSLSTALRNGAQQLYYGRVLTLDQIVAEYEAVTCADVQRVAQRLIRPEQLHLAVIGPYRKRETAALQTLIEEWQP
jgi:predicted Zn-dependent peptidase